MISTPAFFSRFAAAIASSWDFPSVNKTRKNGVSNLAPASALMFSSMTWSSAWPTRRMHSYIPTDTVHSIYFRVKYQRRILWHVFTCKCVSTLISEIPYCFQQLVFSGEVVKIPLCARVPTVLGQTWDKNKRTNKKKNLTHITKNTVTHLNIVAFFCCFFFVLCVFIFGW